MGLIAYGTNSVVYMLSVQNNTVVDRVNGADVPELNKKIRQHATAASSKTNKEVV